MLNLNAPVPAEAISVLADHFKMSVEINEEVDVDDATVKELEVQWLNADSVLADRNLTMQLRVTEGGAAASGARLIFRFARPGAAPFYTQAVADSGGAAEIKIEVEESALPDSSLLVQANFEGRTATRKFTLSKAE